MIYRVFVKKGCGACKNVRRLLREKGVKFEELDVSIKENWDLARRLGVTSTGVVIDENDNKVLISEL